jgi:predicted neutral ceramidase superfamily lipid hydrolase
MAGEAQRRSEWPLVLSLLVGLAGLVVLTFYNWRNGVFIFAGGVILAGLLRVTLTDSAAGLLHVRSRMFDTAFLLAAGAAIAVLGLVIPS